MKILFKNGDTREVSFEEQEGKKAFWHTSAHILAQAVKRLYPDTKCAIGPAIENGFYYDFEFEFPFSEESLPAIEEEMKKIIKKSFSLQVYGMDREKALTYMAERGEDYKLELIQSLSTDEEISFYRQGEYSEFCAGPHIANTCQVKAFKLLSVAGAYWRGDEKKKMLTRIYGISFPESAQLEEYMDRMEEARRRDHRKLGKELGIFTLMEEGAGFPFFLPKGMALKNLLLDYWRGLHIREGYQEISTPIMLDKRLWETSGHWEHYRENMYTTVVDDTEYAVKPMSCPGGMLVYKMEPHSYRDLPLRLAELGLVHRNEKSGQLHGLMRVRAFTQDDAHIFMTQEQIIEEIQNVVRLIDEVYTKFGFAYHVELSTRPENSMGSDEDWELATKALKDAMDSLKIPYSVNEGDGAFYGPKLDFHLKDSIGRTWQCGTIQLDFQLPQRFEAEYTGADGEKHRPIMIHRVILGSIERFIGILIEHYAGKFPVWISPVQVKLLPVSEKYILYANEASEALKAAGIRVEMDSRNEKLGYKIREARLDKVPYMVIVGEKEQENHTVSVRGRDETCGNQDMGEMSLKELIKIIRDML
ncbi:threonine--tRNA ligase [Parablautia intestinalis]|uniref:Threonine--tRNA ligase n=1 Tax=Parablautia intestinalis TaxID=2320100 RepID=A0A3A9APM8_9FIRM|nr:threonine--tRNA ligase [Parablautia intestinalis]RKI89491.1 threonine--tRNA ligase [Parablautia intestinalis]